MDLNLYLSFTIKNHVIQISLRILQMKRKINTEKKEKKRTIVFQGNE